MRIYKILLIIAILVSAFKVVDISYNAPHGRWDAWAIWNLRARYLYEDNFAQAFSPALPHSDYPILLPGLVAFGWKLIQQPHPIVPVMLAAAILASLSYLFFITIHKNGLKDQAIILTTVLLLLPNFVFSGSTQLADTPLAFFIFLTVVCLEKLRRSNKPQWAIMAGLVASFALWTKNEGVLFLLTMGIAYFTVLIRPSNFVRFAGVLAPFLLAYAYFKFAIVPANDVINEQTGNTLEKLLSFDRYLTIGAAYSQMVGIYVAVIVLLLFVSIKPAHIHSGSDVPAFSEHYRPLLVAVLMLMGYFGIYLITPHDLVWHLNSSLDRLVIHVLPITLFGIAPYMGWFSPLYYSARIKTT